MHTLRKTAKMSKLVAKERFPLAELRRMTWYDENGNRTEGFGDPKTAYCLEPFSTYAIGLDEESLAKVRAGKLKNASVREDLTKEEALAEAALVIDKIGPVRFATGSNGGVDLDQRDLAWKKYTAAATLKDDAKIRWMMQNRLQVCVELSGVPEKVVAYYNEHRDEIDAEIQAAQAAALEAAKQADAEQAA